MFNIDNHGLAIGRLTDEIKVFPNNDGSRRLLMTIAVQDAFRSRNGTKSAQFIPLTAFLPASRPDGIFSNIHKGDKVSVQYTVRNNNYTDRNGNPVYALDLVIEEIRMQEPKSVTTARHAALSAATA